MLAAAHLILRIKKTLLLPIACSIVAAGGCVSLKEFGKDSPWQADAVIRSSWKKDRPLNMSCHVLTWLITKSDNVLVEDCVVWCSWKERNNARWALVRCWRHPLNSTEWSIWDVTHAPPDVAGSCIYEGMPSIVDARKFLKNCWWSFSGEGTMQGFRLLRAGIPVGNWHKCFGQEPPSHYFDDLSEWIRKGANQVVADGVSSSTNSPSSQPVASPKQPEKK